MSLQSGELQMISGMGLENWEWGWDVQNWEWLGCGKLGMVGMCKTGNGWDVENREWLGCGKWGIVVADGKLGMGLGWPGVNVHAVRGMVY